MICINSMHPFKPSRKLQSAGAPTLPTEEGAVPDAVVPYQASKNRMNIQPKYRENISNLSACGKVLCEKRTDFTRIAQQNLQKPDMQRVKEVGSTNVSLALVLRKEFTDSGMASAHKDASKYLLSVNALPANLHCGSGRTLNNELDLTMKYLCQGLTGNICSLSHKQIPSMKQNAFFAPASVDRLRTKLSHPNIGHLQAPAPASSSDFILFSPMCLSVTHEKKDPEQKRSSGNLSASVLTPPPEFSLLGATLIDPGKEVSLGIAFMYCGFVLSVHMNVLYNHYV